MDLLNVTNTEIQEVLETFPILNSIKDETLRGQVIGLWIRSWKQSGVERLKDIPSYDEHNDGERLCNYVNCVALAVKGAAKAFEEEYRLPIRYDYLIAGAMLCDVDKPFCFTYNEENERVLTDLGRMMPHGSYGTALAIEAGIPFEIAQVADCHSGYASRVHSSTPENVLIEYVDKCIRRARMIHRGGTVGGKTGYGG